MLIDQLSTAYKCHSSIGNSIDLKEMIHEVLKTFVRESFAIYGQFCLLDKDGISKPFDSFGKMGSFDSEKYAGSDDTLALIDDNELKIIKITLENGYLFLASKSLNAYDSFFISMFESLIPKLNLSVNACINYEKLKNSNDLLKEQREALIRANKTKDDFLANMSHELKTPLNSITVISTILSKNKNNKLESQEVKSMKIIKKCAEDLSILINDILDISKIEAGELKIHKSNISLKALIEELYDSFEPLAIDKGVSLINNFQIKNYDIFSDELRIKQIIKNLLSNALKFTTKGKVEISSMEYDDYLEVNIIDTGIGMDKIQLPDIFDRFKQVDNSRTRKYKGTGLGLAISKELSILLEGDLEVSSEVGIGTTFKYIIPKKSYNRLLQKDTEETQKILEQNLTPIIHKDILDKQIYLYHSNSMAQFRITIALKKHGFNIVPILNESKLKEIIETLKNDNYLFILDFDGINFERIISMYPKLKSNLIVLNDKDNLLDDNFIKISTNDDNDIVENLITHFKNINPLDKEI